jgi:hypothetical protein
MTDVSDLDSFVDHPLVGHFIKFERKKIPSRSKASYSLMDLGTNTTLH